MSELSVNVVVVQSETIEYTAIEKILLSEWLMPYIDDGATKRWPAPRITETSYYREWNTRENALAFIEKVKTLESTVDAYIQE